MTTPTFPETLPSGESGPLAPTIAAIVGGDFSRSRLAALSDLDRERATYLRQHWLEIPSTERHALLLALAELSEESVEFNFNRVFRVALEDPDPVIRQLAIVDLWEDTGVDLPSIFVRMLRSDESDDVRAAAADALSAASDAIADGDAHLLDREDLIELFLELVEDPLESPLVRRRALGAVAAFAGDPRIPELIRLALDDDDQTVVAGAIYAMGRTSSARWVPELIEFMQSEDAELRFEAARASGLLGEADVVPELAELVYDPDSEVRSAALDALGSIGGPAAIRVLRQVEQDEDFDDTRLVDEALDAAFAAINPLERQS
ncbi:MAG: HEAT repeat domain-containing protein [Thermomicrobiales bacterium]|nr:HEAT repeat domain-containing protein [Thermomicrobiales bacterium]